MGNSKKQAIVTFKVDDQLAKILKKLPNTSEFVREAVLSALENQCPLCQGSGRLSDEQRKHWQAFSAHHEVAQCDQCQAVHLVCQSAEISSAH